MTTKKILIIVLGAVAALLLLVVLFVGAVVGVAFYAVGHSEAADVARNFLRGSERLKQDIGDVKDFGTLVNGNVNVHNADGDATLYLKVIGTRHTVNATVDLMHRAAQPWRVTAATYQNGAGQTIDLLKSYDSLRTASLIGMI